MNIVKKLTKQREFFIFFVIVCIMVAMTIYSPIFLTFANLSVLFLSLSIAVIIAVGMTNLMVSGGFDMWALSWRFPGLWRALCCEAARR